MGWETAGIVSVVREVDKTGSSGQMLPPMSIEKTISGTACWLPWADGRKVSLRLQVLHDFIKNKHPKTCALPLLSTVGQPYPFTDSSPQRTSSYFSRGSIGTTSAMSMSQDPIFQPQYCAHFFGSPTDVYQASIAVPLPNKIRVSTEALFR